MEWVYKSQNHWRGLERGFLSATFTVQSVAHSYMQAFFSMVSATLPSPRCFTSVNISVNISAPLHSAVLKSFFLHPVFYTVPGFFSTLFQHSYGFFPLNVCLAFCTLRICCHHSISFALRGFYSLYKYYCISREVLFLTVREYLLI
jgi:hypothetical protein